MCTIVCVMRRVGVYQCMRHEACWCVPMMHVGAQGSYVSEERMRKCVAVAEK